MNSDLKAQLWEFKSTAVKETEFGDGQKAIIILGPVSQLKSLQKIQVQLVRELEKKFSRKHVVFIAQRILPKPTEKNSYKKQAEASQKQHSDQLCTMQSLRTWVFPSQIVGKKLDGSQFTKVHLTKHSRTMWNPKMKLFLVPI